MGKTLTSRSSDAVARALACTAFALGACLALGGCGSGTTLETATEMPKTPRRPDGVVVEPTAVIPRPQERAPARGVVALREPLADKDVEEVVRAYLRAFEREDLEALVGLLAQEAAPIGRPGTTRVHLQELWRTKFKSFEYQKVAGLEIARMTQLERYPFESLGGPDAPARPSEMRAGDLYVRVPILTPRVGNEQLFGDVLVLLLRREDGRLKIAGQADESAN